MSRHDKDGFLLFDFLSKVTSSFFLATSPPICWSRWVYSIRRQTKPPNLSQASLVINFCRNGLPLHPNYSGRLMS